MKNILFLHAGAEMYGADKVMLDLIKRLDKSKYNPLVILPTDGVLVDAFKKENIKVIVMPYPIMRRKYFNLNGLIRYAYGMVKYTNKITKIAKKKHIDLIHTNTAATLEGSFVSRKLHVPQLWSIHEIVVNPKIMYSVTSKLIAKYSSITITDSKAVKDHIDASGYFKENAVKVIYNGVDLNASNETISVNEADVNLKKARQELLQKLRSLRDYCQHVNRNKSCEIQQQLDTQPISRVLK